MNGTHPRHTRRLATLTLSLGLVSSLGLSLTPARAADPVQPGKTSYINFGETRRVGNVELRVGYGDKLGESDVFEHQVKVCNRGSEPQPVGPDTFSYTTKDRNTRIYQPHDGYLYYGLKNQLLAPGRCVTGSLVSMGQAPNLLSFHDLRTNQRVDVLPATEWEGIAKVGWPRSEGTSNHHGDFTNDRVADVVALSQGQIVTYRTVSGPALANAVGTGARGVNSAYTWVGKANDMDHNGATDLLARDSSGTLWQQRMMGNNRAGFATIIGYGFNDAKDITVLNDVNGDGAAELLVIRKDNRLTRQSVRPVRVSDPVTIGQNFGKMREIFSVGDFSGDGRADLLAINTDGNLYRYTLDSRARITATTVVGHGWTNFSQVYSPGDLNRDGRRDMVGVRRDGNLYYYANLGNGRWGKAKQIGQHWQKISSMA
ncbi:MULTISPECIES: FG-GAP-like repeat-containing protein [unclassified Luteococcus]|uniref:FG-GAP-like repeat-containing protein n=1 Tax=unclassified Luteococcus TaxID=2639923 RepID=UPI00313E36F4